MIDLEQERRDFKKTWMVLGGHFKYLVVGENQAYHLANNAPNLTPLEKELTLSAVNTAWAMWLIQARAKQAEIDSLKGQLANVKNDGLDFEQLYLMALKNSKKQKYVLNWVHVSRHGPGSTKAVKICKHLGIDPEGTEFRKEVEGGYCG